MPTKQQQLADLLIQTTKEVTTNFANWTGFLTTVGNLYKYPFHEQLLIYAQKPEATACAEYSLWNDTMNRYVCRGAKGIGIIDPIQDNPKIKYIFDIADTGTREKSRSPFLWKMEKHHEQPILAMLQEKFDVTNDTIYDTIDNIANSLAKGYYEDNSYSIKHLVADSFLEELDEDSIRVSVENAVATSLSYTLMQRMGMDVSEHFDHKDFRSVFDFNSPATVTLLGTAVSEQSEQVLREIAKTIGEIERRLQHEQFDIQTRGRLLDSQNSNEGEQHNTGQVWENAKSTSHGAPQTIVQLPIVEREIDGASRGNRPDSEHTNGAVDDRVAEETTSTQQNDTANGVGISYEQFASTSRGNHPEGIDLQLKKDTTEQLELFPTEQEQIQNIADRQRGQTQRPSAISLETRQKADKLARYMEQFFNGIDTKYKGTILADMPEIKAWDNTKSKKNHLSLSFTSPVADMGENAFTYFNKEDKIDEIAMNEAIYNDPFLSQFREDKDFSISFTPTNIYLFFHNFEDKILDYSLAPDMEYLPLDAQPKPLTPYFEGYTNIKKEYPDAIVLYPLGDFFETFGADAKVMADTFDLSTSHRVLDDSGKRIPMVGIPNFSLEGYVEQLQNDGHTVVVCNQEDGEIKPYFMEKGETSIVANTKEITQPLPEMKAKNFRITDDKLGVASKAEKIVYNLDAIRTLKTLEKENRQATNERAEQNWELVVDR